MGTNFERYINVVTLHVWQNSLFQSNIIYLNRLIDFNEMNSQQIHFQTISYLNKKGSYTVFCQIHAPARTPKSSEGRVYSGVIISKSNDVGRLRGFPNLQFRF